MTTPAIVKLRKELRFSSPVFRHALRSAFAVTLAIAASHILNLHHGIWLPISVLVIMRPSLGGTLRIGWNRLLGTVIGASIGIGMLRSLGEHHGILIPLILTALFLTLFLKVYNYTAYITALTTMVVLALGLIMPMGWKLGMIRILDTFLGVGIGVGCAFLLWPTRARKSIRRETKKTLCALEKHFSLLADHYLSGQTGNDSVIPSRIKVNEQLAECRESFREAAAEPGLSSAQRQELSRLLRTFSRIADLLSALYTVITRAKGKPLPEIKEDTATLLKETRELFSWMVSYAGSPETCGDKPDHRSAIHRFLIMGSRLRSIGTFDKVPLQRRNNISALVWNIRTIGAELDLAHERITALRKGRKN
ncbi:FUSC family protein [Desulfobacula phenolica]|uniref:Fusaric acid resistance protein-like n=1 Tax=Desulfobacula phenolica TaxID=90732 RepID=A0A1H2IE37_9BACT|nr:FUSC family protein [Desulfobacula phenolica]SDU42440.1 Fusaric acid resistance protein-like [Desulfobacula phenolica]